MREITDWQTHCAQMGDVVLLHTAKVCTKTVATALCPPMRRRTLASLDRKDFHVVGLVRHPLDRLVSVWADCSQEHRIHLIDRHRITRATIPGVYSGMSFEKFCDVVEAHPGINRHWMPMQWWLDWNGQPDQIIKYERLRKEWSALRWKYKFLPEFPRVMHNKSERESWQKYYTDDLEARMRAVYADDFKAFRYDAGSV